MAKPLWKQQVQKEKDRADMLDLALFDVLRGHVHWIKRGSFRVGVIVRSLPLVILDFGGTSYVHPLHEWADKVIEAAAIPANFDIRQLAIDAVAYHRKATA